MTNEELKKILQIERFQRILTENLVTNLRTQLNHHKQDIERLQELVISQAKELEDLEIEECRRIYGKDQG